jgi:hypothetical protein
MDPHSFHSDKGRLVQHLWAPETLIADRDHLQHT